MYRLAVFGNPVAHSRSPQIHAMFAAQCGISVDYQRVLVPPGMFLNSASEFLDQGGMGFNITMPFKYDAFQFAQRHSTSARLAEAVNTISVTDDGTIVGDNTDGPGLVSDIQLNLGWTLENQRVLIVGAGGAIRGVIRDLMACNPAQVHIYNRTRSKAEDIADKVNDARLKSVIHGDLVEGYDLIINGTSAGLQGSALALPSSIITGSTRCYDLSYAKGLTSFLNWCSENGCMALSDGLGMLVEQAAKSFNIWFSEPVVTGSVIAALRSGAHDTGP